MGLLPVGAVYDRALTKCAVIDRAYNTERTGIAPASSVTAPAASLPQ